MAGPCSKIPDLLVVGGGRTLRLLLHVDKRQTWRTQACIKQTITNTITHTHSQRQSCTPIRKQRQPQQQPDIPAVLLKPTNLVCQWHQSSRHSQRHCAILPKLLGVPSFTRRGQHPAADAAKHKQLPHLLPLAVVVAANRGYCRACYSPSNHLHVCGCEGGGVQTLPQHVDSTLTSPN